MERYAAVGANSSSNWNDTGHLSRAGPPDGRAWFRGKTNSASSLRDDLNEDGVDNADIARWLESAISSLDAHRILSDGIRAGTIEAVLWIAILALPASPAISIAPRFVDAVAALGATIFLEDYNKPDENGFFDKQWFP